MSLYDGRDKEEWYLELRTQKPWMDKHFYAAMALFGQPDSFLDVGCGYGMLVLRARLMEIEAYGVDQLIEEDPKLPFLFEANLVEKFTPPKQVSMVWCTEVAEHLDSSAHATLCDTCADALLEGRGNYLIFSSAYPNQGGKEHVSERPSKYWLDQFALRGLGYRKDLTVNLALLWSNINSPLFWLANNVLVFEK